MKQYPWLFSLAIFFVACQNKPVLGPGFGEPLKVVSVTPADGATGVGASDKISITFNQTVEVATATGQTTTGGCSGSIQISATSFSDCVPIIVDTNANPVIRVNARDGFFALTTYKLRVTTAIKGPKGTLAEEYVLSTGFKIYGAWELTAQTGAGKVSAIAVKDNIAYMAGNFTYAGPKDNVSRIAFMNSDGTFKATSGIARVNGIVHTTISDGAGGFYIGGSFTAVNDQLRSGVARINADGSLHAFNISLNTGGAVYALGLSGNTLYLGGTFTSINGTGRNLGGAVDVSTYAVTSFNPSFSGGSNVIYAIAISATSVYYGGGFGQSGASTRNHLAEFDLSTGALTGWHPNLSGGPGQPLVRAMILNGSTIFVAGSFATVSTGGAACTSGPFTRNNIAEISLVNTGAGNGCATAWNPNLTFGATEYVIDLAIAAGTLYVGGSFYSINNVNSAVSSCGAGAVTRRNLVALSTTTACATAFNPNINTSGGAEYSIIYALYLSGTSLHIGGQYTLVGTAPASHYSVFNTGTSARIAGTAAFSQYVTKIAASGSNLLAVGNFVSAGGRSLAHIGALDLTSGEFTSWLPVLDWYQGGGLVDTPVNVMAIYANTLYLGGTTESGGLLSVNGIAQNTFMALDLTTGASISLAKRPAGINSYRSINSFEIAATTLYIGGKFSLLCNDPPTCASTVTQERLALFDLTSSTFINGSPGTVTESVGYGSGGAYFKGLAVGTDRVFLGGGFQAIGGISRNCLAAFDLNTYNLNTQDFNLGPISLSTEISALTYYNGILYAMGSFQSIGASIRSNFAALNATTGSLLSTTADTDSSIKYSLRLGNQLYMGGGFSTVKSKPRARLASLDLNTGGLTIWNPNPSSDIRALATDGKYVLVGGTFTSVGGQSRNLFAILDPETGLAR